MIIPKTRRVSTLAQGLVNFEQKPSAGAKSNYLSLVLMNPPFFQFFTSENDKLSNDTTFSVPKMPGKLGILSFKIEI